MQCQTLYGGETKDDGGKRDGLDQDIVQQHVQSKDATTQASIIIICAMRYHDGWLLQCY
jgi:hypothetical protein